MYIESIHVKDHKSLLDTGEIRLAPGFTVIIGKNDAGKSALIEAISLASPLKPHSSPKTVPRIGATSAAQPRVSIAFRLTGEDVQRCISSQSQFILTAAKPSMGVELARYVQGIACAGETVLTEWDGINLLRASLLQPPAPGDGTSFRFTREGPPDGTQLRWDIVSSRSVTETLPWIFTSACRSQIYSFKAERLGVSECHILGRHELLPNASNLPDVLLTLMSSDALRREQFLSLVRQVFPHITQITSQPVRDTQLSRIYVHTAPVEEGRADLAVPLSESGTGIGQVLAILYVVVTSHESRIIIIDEPQSFLHPGAARKLLDILRFQFPQHQYVISTHAPIPLRNTQSDRLLIVRKDGYESVIEQVDHTTENALRTSLAEVGMRHSDVFGADAILWVEGKTEETCFPKLIRELGKAHLLGVQILGVISTDELANKQAERMFDIYGRLSGGSSLLPPALAFVLDMEERNEAQREDIERKSGGKVTWLPRRMYENYLIVPSAIAALINQEDSARDQPVTEAQVTAWLTAEGGKTDYHKPLAARVYGTAEWDIRVRGANVLSDLFGHFTEARVAYSKVRHGEALTDLLITSPTPALQELADMLAEIVQPA